MRLIFNPFSVLSLALVLGAAAPSVFAQAEDDDLYGTPGASEPESPTDSPAVPPVETPAEVPADTATEPAVDSLPDSPDDSPVDTAVGTAPATSVDTTPAAPPPVRTRITRETTINPLDTDRGGYRNPKKALFMSLLVPGLGQAYVGQSTFNYARAAVYFGTELTLGFMWYHYTVTKYDRQTARYRRFADSNWSQGAYEQRVFDASGELLPENFRAINPFRTSYCDAVTGRGTSAADSLYRWCSDPSEHASYPNFKGDFDDRGMTADSIGTFRNRFDDAVEFYSLIGSYQEFVGGWDDNTGVAYSDSGITGSSANRDIYNAMRGKAQDYSKMQAWFIGGIVVNHIASAIDAALTARHNNRVLYEGEARWYDRVNLDGGLAFDQGRPFTRLTARLSF